MKVDVLNVLRNAWLYTLVPLGAVADNSQDPLGPWYLSDQESGWYFDTFVGLEYEPSYAGSNSYELEPAANLRVFYRDSADNRYFVSLGEMGAFFNLGPDLVLSTSLEYEDGRDAEDDPLLQGFDEVEATLEGHFSLFYRFLPNTYAGMVYQPDLLGRGKGQVYFFALGNDTLLFSDKFRLSTAFDVSFGNGQYMQTEFGVNETAAAASGLSPFRPQSGIKSATLSVNVEYLLSERWRLLLNSEVENYFGDAAQSPLIKDEGSNVTYEVMGGLRFRF